MIISAIQITAPEGVRTLGMRSSAKPFLEAALRSLTEGDSINLDFAGVDATQGFVDELVGSLIMRFGKPVLKRISFAHCTDDVKAIIRFVVNDRLSS
jgi:hypothetical protein